MRNISRLVMATVCALMLGAPGASAQRHGGGARGPAAGGMAVPRGPVGGGPRIPSGARGTGIVHGSGGVHGPSGWRGTGAWRGNGPYARPWVGYGRPWVGHGSYYQPWTGGYPFWPYYYGGYPYWYDWNYPAYDVSAEVHLHVKPDTAAVYVDGYYAGVVDDFDGAFGSLEVTPGGHAITLYLDGYQTFQRSVYVSLGHHASIRHTMEPLAAGAHSEPPATAPPADEED